MPSGRIIKTGLTDLYDARIKNQWIQGYGEPDHEYEQFLRTEKIGTQDTRYSLISGFGQWALKPMGTNVTFDSIYEGKNTICTPTTYALAYTIEQETVEDDPQGLLGGQLATALAQSGRETLETLAASMFNNATSTSYSSPWVTTSTTNGQGDGKALLATDHPILSGGSYANTPSSAADLSIASLKAARTRMEKMQGARGQKWPMEARTLVVPTESRWLMSEILGTDKVPYSADNTVNVAREGITGKVWSRLVAGNGCWFILADKAGSVGSKGHMLTCVMRLSPEFDRDNIFDSGDRRYKGRFRVGFCAPDFRGIDGSLGS
jgi:hypothetical protein